jgi:hypothetical protein
MASIIVICADLANFAYTPRDADAPRLNAMNHPYEPREVYSGQVSAA